jgi:hypothetical protein
MASIEQPVLVEVLTFQIDLTHAAAATLPKMR